MEGMAISFLTHKETERDKRVLAMVATKKLRMVIVLLTGRFAAGVTVSSAPHIAPNRACACDPHHSEYTHGVLMLRRRGLCQRRLEPAAMLRDASIHWMDAPQHEV